MKPMDLPGSKRTLSESDNRFVPVREYRPDGSARPPAELLEDLRLRLSLLPGNHPSASGDSQRPVSIPDWRVARDDPGRIAPPDWQARSGRFDQPDRFDQPGRLYQPGQPGRLEHPERAAAPDENEAPGHASIPAPDAASANGRAADAWGTARWADQDLLGSDGQGRGGADLRLGLSGADEAYRPWFVSADSAAPWFAAD